MGGACYAIVIDVPAPADTCLIAIPFSSDFAALSACIEQAAGRVNLKPIRSDNLPAGDDFMQRFLVLLRAARLVVAVCAPAAKPNPNVMYELGLAHALGKPTLIVTDNAKALPANLRRLSAVRYRPTDVRQSEPFINRLVIAATQLMGVTGPLTDPRVPGITVAHAGDRMILQPVFWPNLECILSFAFDMHRRSQMIKRLYVDDLLKAADEVLSNADFARSVHAFNTALNKYYEHHKLVITAEEPEIQRRFERVERAFADLTGIAAGSGRSESVQSGRDCYSRLKDSYAGFGETHQRFITQARELVGNRPDADRQERIWKLTRELDDGIEELQLRAYALMKSAMDVIGTGTGERAAASGRP